MTYKITVKEILWEIMQKTELETKVDVIFDLAKKVDYWISDNPYQNHLGAMTRMNHIEEKVNAFDKWKTKLEENADADKDYSLFTKKNLKIAGAGAGVGTGVTLVASKGGWTAVAAAIKSFFTTMSMFK